MLLLTGVCAALVMLGMQACGGVDSIGSVVPVSLVGGGSAGMQPSAAVDSATSSDAGSRLTMPSKPAMGELAPLAGSGGPRSAPLTDPLCYEDGVDPETCEQTRTLAFGHAICSCGDVLGTGSFSTETVGAAGARADVGVDQSLSLRIGRRNPTGDLAGGVDGSLVLGGTGPAPVGGDAPVISGDLKLAGALNFAGSIQVLGDAYSRELPVGTGTLAIAGDLHHDSQLGAAATLPPNVTVAGKLISEDYASAPPCACAPSAMPEITQMIAAAASGNDNARVGIDPNSLVNLIAARPVEFGCGRYFLSTVSSLAGLQWNVSGHVTVFVFGDVAVKGDVAVTLAPDAQLDLVIGGNLTLDGAARFGDPTRPGASRIYVQGQVQLSSMGDLPTLARPTTAFGESVIVGNLYAPAATLLIAPPTDVYGSLFVGKLLILQNVLVHYDPSVIAQPAACAGSTL